MDLEQRLRASLVAPDPGPMFTARVMTRLGIGVARRSRFILAATVLVVSAAAAVLAWRIFDVPSLPLESAAIPAISVLATEVKTAAPSIAEVSEPVGAESELPTPGGIPPRFSVLLMPLQAATLDADKRAPLEALHAALVDQLRKVPGLSLRRPDEPDGGTGGDADYVLTVSGLATAVSQSGGAVFRSTDGGNTFTVHPGNRNLGVDTSVPGDGGLAAATYGANAMNGVVGQMLNNRLAGVDIDYGIEEARDGGANFFSSGRGSMSSVSASGAVTSFNPGDFSSPESVVWVELRVKSRQAVASRYTFPVGVAGNATQLAATQVDMLRLQVFPPDAAFQQRLMARLRDTGEDGGKVLQDLLPLLTGDGGSRMDSATINALFKFAAGQPADTRKRVWSTLRQVSHPALVAPLLESLRHDPEQPVRLAALASLETNHSTDPVVRSAFERIERDERDAIVRAALRWALYGEAQWRNDVLVALNAAELPYESRLAPLIARTAADFSPTQSLQMSRVRSAALREPQVLGPLVALIREHRRESGHARATGDVLRMLGNVDDPAVFDLFTQLMREPSPPEISGPVSSWALNHRNDPRVREGLPQIEHRLPSNLLQRMEEVTEAAAPDPARSMVR